MMLRRFLLLVVVLLLGTVAPRAFAQSTAAQGVAVLATNGARDDAFALARALYMTGARPRSLDEIRVRILAGDAPPPGAIKDLRELAELRASIAGEDAASRRLLASIAQQLGLQAIVVVTSKPVEDAGTAATARLFIAETGDFDAARWDPTPGEAPWQATATSIAARFPAPSAPPPPAEAIPPKPLPKPPPEKKENTPFYKSVWLWGAVGAALLIGGIFFFATRDTGDDPIHVRMTVPR